MSIATTSIDKVENVTPIPRPARAPALRDGLIVCAASGEEGRKWLLEVW